MPTEKPRFSVTFESDSFSRIKRYQAENRISTQSKAVSQLVELALLDMEKTEKALSLSDKAQIVAERYSELDPHGQEAVDAILDVEYRRCTESSRPSEIRMIKAAARSGDVSEIEEVYREDLSEDEAIPV